MGSVVLWASFVAAQPYTLVDLGPLLPVGINSDGEVVGTFTAQPGAALVRPDGTVVALGYLPSQVDDRCNPCGPFTRPAATAHNYVVGQASTGLFNLQTHAFIWTPWGGMVDLGTRGDPNLFSAAQAVDSLGVASGYASRPTGTTGPVVWVAGQLSDLPTLGGAGGFPIAMNDTGEIVGEAQDATGAFHAVRWPLEGGIENIDTVGGTTSFATTISSLGGIGGEVTLPGGQGRRGFFWTRDTGMVALAPLPGDGSSTVKGYNAASVLVGVSFTLPPDCCTVIEHAIGWYGNIPVDLSTLVTNLPAGWVLQEARGINDAGQITGFAVVQGQWRGFRLDPVPPVAVASSLRRVSRVAGR